MSLLSASSQGGWLLQQRAHPSPGFSAGISLCCGCFQPLPLISVSLPSQLGLLLPTPSINWFPVCLPAAPGCCPTPARLGSAYFTAGHHLQLLETRPALLTQEEPVPCVTALNGPLSLLWDVGLCCVPGMGRTCFPEMRWLWIVTQIELITQDRCLTCRACKTSDEHSASSSFPR